MILREYLEQRLKMLDDEEKQRCAELNRLVGHRESISNMLVSLPDEMLDTDSPESDTYILEPTNVQPADMEMGG